MRGNQDEEKDGRVRGEGSRKKMTRMEMDAHERGSDVDDSEKE